MTLKSHAKYEEKLTCDLENDMKIWQFFGEFTEELCVMKQKNDKRFEEELTCRFKIDKRNLTSFDWST